MIADEVSHDVLAALVGGLALIIVATIPLVWLWLSQQNKKNGKG